MLTFHFSASIKSDRAYRANRSLGFIIFFVTFAITLYLQRYSVALAVSSLSKLRALPAVAAVCPALYRSAPFRIPSHSRHFCPHQYGADKCVGTRHMLHSATRTWAHANIMRTLTHTSSFPRLLASLKRLRNGQRGEMMTRAMLEYFLTSVRTSSLSQRRSMCTIVFLVASFPVVYRQRLCSWLLGAAVSKVRQPMMTTLGETREGRDRGCERVRDLSEIPVLLPCSNKRERALLRVSRPSLIT